MRRVRVFPSPRPVTRCRPARSGLALSRSHGRTYALFREDRKASCDNKSRKRKITRLLKDQAALFAHVIFAFLVFSDIK